MYYGKERTKTNEKRREETSKEKIISSNNSLGRQGQTLDAFLIYDTIYNTISGGLVMADQKGHGHGNKGAPFTQNPGSGKGSNWPKAGDANTKGWNEKIGKGTAPKQK